MSAVALREKSALRLAALTAGLMIAAQVAAKATRDAMFLGRFAARDLPIAMVAAGAGSLIAVIVFSRVMRRRGPQSVVPATFVLSGAAFAFEWLASPIYPDAVLTLLYLHIATLGGVAISGFWSLYTECFDPATAKRLIGKVGAAASLGGLVGGAAAERVAVLADVPASLLLLAVLNVATAAGAFALGRRAAPKPLTQTELEPTRSILGGSQYLKQIALLVVLVSLSGAFVDFAFKVQAQAEFPGEGQLLRFFAAFYAATSLLTFLVQALWTQRLLERLGLAATLVVLPAGVLVFSVLGAAVTRVWALVLLRGLSGVVGHALFRPSYELLYTPIPRDHKRSVKTIIDVAFTRVGDVAGALVVLGVAFSFPLWAPKISVGLAACAACGSLLIAWRLHAGYVAALADSLRAGTVELTAAEGLDATTRRTFADTTMALQRDQLLAEIETFRRDKLAKPTEVGGEASPARVSATPAVTPLKDVLRSETLILTADDSAALLALLEDDTRLQPQLAPFIIPLLARQDVRSQARRALRVLAPRIVGQLHDALLDEALPRAARRHVPSVLSGHRHARSVQALVAGLHDARLSLRYRSGQALFAIFAEDPSVVQIEPSVIHERVLAELASGVGDKHEEHHDHEFAPTPWLDDAIRDRLHRKMEHVFSLLSLVYDSSALQLSLRALYAKDERLRGTALEYLDTVLPLEVKNAVWTHLDLEHQRDKARRSEGEVLRELLVSADGLVIDPDLLRGPGRA